MKIPKQFIIHGHIIKVIQKEIEIEEYDYDYLYNSIYDDLSAILHEKLHNQ